MRRRLRWSAFPMTLLFLFVGTLPGQRDENPARQSEMEVRALTGIGSPAQ